MELREKIQNAIDDNQNEVDWVDTEKAADAILEAMIATLPEEFPNNPEQNEVAGAYDTAYNQCIRDIREKLEAAKERNNE